MSCEPSEDVLIEAAGDCSSADVICSTSVDILGIVMSLSVYYEIVGEEEEQCALYVRMEDVSVSFTEEFIRLALLDEDLTREDVLQMEDEMNAEASRAEGQDGVCEFDSTEDLVAFLTVMKGDGDSFGASCNIVDGEWLCGEEKGVKCEGDLFEGTAD
jgi:hypothetical protein